MVHQLEHTCLFVSKHEAVIDAGAAVPFVHGLSGGLAAPFLLELNGWGKTLPVNRDAPGELLRYGSSNTELHKCLLLVAAMLKNAASCHLEYVENGKAIILSGNDDLKVGKLTVEFGNAHRMHRQARAFLV